MVQDMSPMSHDVLSEALAIFDSLPGRRVQADLISYNALLSACEKAARWQLALHFLQQLRSLRVQGDIVMILGVKVSKKTLLSSFRVLRTSFQERFNAKDSKDLQRNLSEGAKV